MTSGGGEVGVVEGRGAGGCEAVAGADVGAGRLVATGLLGGRLGITGVGGGAVGSVTIAEGAKVGSPIVAEAARVGGITIAVGSEVGAPIVAEAARVAAGGVTSDASVGPSVPVVTIGPAGARTIRAPISSAITQRITATIQLGFILGIAEDSPIYRAK